MPTQKNTLITFANVTNKLNTLHGMAAQASTAKRSPIFTKIGNLV